MPIIKKRSKSAILPGAAMQQPGVFGFFLRLNITARKIFPRQ